MVEVWLLLGVKDEARKYAAVLGYNYPGSKWYAYSYKLLEGDVGDAPEPEDSSWFW
jgi:outer membrane protein assembly factor BamD